MFSQRYKYNTETKYPKKMSTLGNTLLMGYSQARDTIFNV